MASIVIIIIIRVRQLISEEWTVPFWERCAQRPELSIPGNGVK